MAGKATNIYISERLKEKLSEIKRTKYTIVHAPVGYGKTQTVKSFLKGTGYNVLWINCDTAKEIFWNEFCHAVSKSSACGEDVLKNLINIGFPGNVGDSLEIIKLIGELSFNNKTILVLDNYNVVECDTLDHVFWTLREKENLDYKAVFITGNHIDHTGLKFIVRNWVNYINIDDFSFTPDDIKEYFKINGAEITLQKADEIYAFSDGWPIIVNYQLRQHLKEKNFNITALINEFINNEIFFSMPEDEKMFLIKMSIFEYFTIEQAAAWNEMTILQVKKYIENNILVRYNSIERIYYMNPLIRKYLEKDFNAIPEYERNEMFVSVGNLYNETGEFVEAVKCYYRAGNFQKMFEGKVNQKKLFQSVIKENKNMFLMAADSYFGLENKGDYQFAIALVIIMFLYNENQLSEELAEQIGRDIKSDKRLGSREKEDCFTDLAYAASFMNFNNYEVINKEIHMIETGQRRTSGRICGNIPFAYGSPSILLLYHSNPGKLEEEVSFMEKTSNIYYKFTGGHGKGFETVAKAEMYYLRGDIETAEILCLKAMYIADSRNQLSIFLAANLILTRISVFTGDKLSFIGRLELFTKKISEVEDASGMYARMVDQCRGFIYSSIREKSRIPDWLKDENRIEDNSNFVTLASANIIYGKYLIIDRQYHHLQAVSGHFIGIAGAHSYIIPKIYTYIYISISNNETGLPAKAQQLLREALELACDDKIYMPFVENFEQISPVMEAMMQNEKYAHFIREVKRIYKIYSKGYKVIAKSYEDKSNYGLTSREADIARLAAHRMSNKEIAEVLYIAESTVKSTMKAVFAKLEINSRSDLKQFFD